MENIENVKNLVQKISQEGEELQQLKDGIDVYKKSINNLDETIKRARRLSIENEGNMTIDQLSMVIQEICPALYFCLAALDTLNTNSSIAEQRRSEKFNRAWESTSGTKDDKLAYAGINSLDEKIVSDLYKSCYKDLDQRIRIGLEVVASYKKALDVKSKELNTLNAQNRVQSM